MPQMNMIQALNSAMDIMLARDPSVIIIGEDVGYFGGVFRTTDGLQRKFGEHRVIEMKGVRPYNRVNTACVLPGDRPRMADLIKQRD